MKRIDIEALAYKDDSEIRCCKVIKRSDSSITFVVDEGLSRPKEHLEKKAGQDLIADMLNNKQIDDVALFDVVASSFAGEKFSSVGSDTLFKCMVQCFAEHRPLVLSPDAIWLVIAQTLARHIREHAEEFRDILVDHKGRLELEVETTKDLADIECDWPGILNSFYSKIERHTKNGVARKFVSDFSTTDIDDRICSIATLMHGVESYFSYSVCRFICGIPNITLHGTVGDWIHLLEKCSVLKDFGMSEWYGWIAPILREFVRSAKGNPHLDFWKSIVQIAHEKDFSMGRGCVPDYHYVDGWCVALFPYVDDESGNICYDKCLNIQKMMPETVRVEFNYKIYNPDGTEIITPMELWCGMVGVEEDKKTYALSPKLGWFVRKSHEHEESLDRLRGANEHKGINIEVDEVPEILNELEYIRSLELRFRDRIVLPEWMLTKPIRELVLYGAIDEDYKVFLKSKFGKISINEDTISSDMEDEDENEVKHYSSHCCMAQIGLNHDLPVDDIHATAVLLSQRMNANIRMFYLDKYTYSHWRHSVSLSKKYRNEIELCCFRQGDYAKTINVEVCNYQLNQIKLKFKGKTFDSLRYGSENARYFFKQDYIATDKPLYDIDIDWQTVSIYRENVNLNINFEANYQIWERAFHGEGEFTHLMAYFRSKIQERAKLFGCREMIICPGEFGPLYRIMENLSLNSTALKEFIRNRDYENEYNGTADDIEFDNLDFSGIEINFREFLDGNIKPSDNEFVSIVLDKVE